MFVFFYLEAHFVIGTMISHCNYTYVSNLPETLECSEFIL